MYGECIKNISIGKEDIFAIKLQSQVHKHYSILNVPFIKKMLKIDPQFYQIIVIVKSTSLCRITNDSQFPYK